MPITSQQQTDEHFMRMALQEANQALAEGEIPIGAVVVSRGRIIARAHNLTETLHDVTAHAEMQAITAAANLLGGKYLTDCTLYVTVEPCVMCAGAIGWAQIKRVVYGAPDEKRGYARLAPHAFHPKCNVLTGVLEAECRDIMQQFFRTKR
ncbi:nucleoside deaminase [Hallella sp.]|uniref:nucleoside deaminase n=1 Tax=Hallella sp. TaxID=2980186 RepID=UPI003079A12B